MLRFLRPTTPDGLADDELLARFRSTGDSAWLGALYSRYMEMVFGVCLKIFKDRERAVDAVMAIFEELLTKAKNHEVASFRGWLYVLSRNHCLMELRKTSRHRTDSLPPDAMARFDGPDPEHDFDLPGSKTALQRCLERLAGHQRAAVEAFYFEEKSYKEISDATGNDLGTVRSHIQNGRRNLRLCMEKSS